VHKQKLCRGRGRGVIENNVSTDGQIAINRQIDVRELRVNARTIDCGRSAITNRVRASVWVFIYPRPRERRSGRRDVPLLLVGPDTAVPDIDPPRWCPPQYWTPPDDRFPILGCPDDRLWVRNRHRGRAVSGNHHRGRQYREDLSR